MLAIHTELKLLVGELQAHAVPYALCGALALAVYGHPRSTYDIDLLALRASGERLRNVAASQGFTLKASPMSFCGGTVRIDRVTKTDASSEEFLSLDILSLSSELEREMRVENLLWEGIVLQVLARESFVRLKMLRGNAQDRADIEAIR